MAHFYITLPSDGSKDVLPSNSAANFKTRLATPISLVGEWDVALYENSLQEIMVRDKPD